MNHQKTVQNIPALSFAILLPFLQILFVVAVAVAVVADAVAVAVAVVAVVAVACRQTVI